MVLVFYQAKIQNKSQETGPEKATDRTEVAAIYLTQRGNHFASSEEKKRNRNYIGDVKVENIQI